MFGLQAKEVDNTRYRLRSKGSSAEVWRCKQVCNVVSGVVQEPHSAGEKG